MNISKTSTKTNKLNEMQMSLNADDYMRGMKEYKNGESIKDAFPTLNKVEREFLVSGMSKEEQKSKS
tara:strand:- start:2286 stop:2486 length:201 start_codon:yes stop_codon:yes gene_type:complete